MSTNSPLKDVVHVVFTQTKDAKIVHVIRCQITQTWIHTFLKGLVSAQHSRKKKNSFLTCIHTQTKQSLEDEEEDDVFSRHPFILWSHW